MKEEKFVIWLLELLAHVRAYCPCGGYFGDWHSHASDCKVINDKGKIYDHRGVVNIKE